MKRIFAALAAGTALGLSVPPLPAFSETIRDHVSTREGEAAWGGREYIVMTRDPDRPVTVVEGAARWTSYRQTQIDRYRPVHGAPVRGLLDLFE